MIAVFGAGGFTHQLIDTLEALNDEIVIVSDPGGASVYGLKHVSSDQMPGAPLVIAVAAPNIRRNIAERYPNHLPANIRAATARVSRHANIGDGHILCDNSIVEAGTRIGRHFHANIFSYVAHECVIGDFVTFAPRVSCNGNVHIGDGVHVWTGAVIRNGSPEEPLTIGEGAIIGMGTIVTRSVPPFSRVYGNPARIVPYENLHIAR